MLTLAGLRPAGSRGRRPGWKRVPFVKNFQIGISSEPVIGIS
jgi:hypothetical protein